MSAMTALGDLGAAARTDRTLRRLDGPMFGALARSAMPMAVADPYQPDAPLIFVNEAFTRLTGYSAAESLGRNCRFLQGADTDPAVVAAVAAALRDEREIHVELLNYRRDGTPFWNSLFIAPVRDDDGALLCFLATQVDVTSVRRARTTEAALQASQQALLEAHARFRVALGTSAGVAGWEWHVGANRIIGDARFAALYRLSAHDEAGGITPETFFSIIHPADRVRIRLAMGGHAARRRSVREGIPHRAAGWRDPLGRWPGAQPFR